jgi:hypothetical protein
MRANCFTSFSPSGPTGNSLVVVSVMNSGSAGGGGVGAAEPEPAPAGSVGAAEPEPEPAPAGSVGVGVGVGVGRLRLLHRLGLGAPPIRVGALAAALEADQAVLGLQLELGEAGLVAGPQDHVAAGRGLGVLVGGPGPVAVDEHHAQEGAVDEDSLHDDFSGVVKSLPALRRRRDARA